MTENDTPFGHFQALLSDIFQFDTADLDFGLYRVLNARRAQVEAFLQTDLQAVVDQAFIDYAATKGEVAAGELDGLRTKIVAAFGPDVFGADGQLAPSVHGFPLGQEFLRAATAAAQAAATDSLKERVYNDLLTFFGRYYEDGDFLPLRRAGREMTYAVPYSGEEVLLHWANRGQYYIKTDDRLAAYRFAVAGGYHVVLEVRSARAEANNNKGAKRFYLLADGDADGYAVDYDPDVRTLHVYFTYRPLTAEEAASYTGNSKQEAINQATFKAVTERVKETALRGALAAPYTLKEGETAPPTAAPTLLRHLTQFTRKNSADFFIHKNLAGFLSGELDQFLKTECLRLDDLLSGSEGDLALLTARARATKAVGEKVIALLASVEDFQRRLFEKRKFILATEYVFTLDRVPAALHAAVLANAAQVQEWRDLYDVDGLLKADGVLGEGGLTLEALQGAPYNRLPVDTRHFDAAFKTDLLASVDDLDELTDGVLFESENLQALNLLTETYRERVKCVYIDPPYNTGGDGFLYKDAYQHSSWLSMMADRLAAARALLPADGALFVSIDDDEQANLKRLMDSVFGGENFVASVIWQKKYAPANDAKWFSDDHDFLVTYARDKEAWRPTKLARDEEQNKGYKNPDNDARGNWKPDNYISNKTADQRPNLYYPIIQPNTGEEIWPSANAVWRYSRERHAQNVAEGRVWWGKDGTNKVPAYKRFLSEVGDVVPRTIWSYEEVGHNQDAVRELRDMFPATDFTSPKPTTLIRRVAEVNPAAITLDFFAGSGTTGNAIINLIRDAAEGAPRRKYLLVEMGAYFHSVLLPRVKKAVFSSKWSEGKPVAPDPVPQTIKYLALEQYEDTLNNLRLRPEGEAQLAMEVYGEDYLLRYLLEFDTAGSPSLLNVADLADPFRYALRVRSGDDFVHQAVDLPETFTYLLGLQVRKVRAFADGEREYRAVLGTDRNGRATAHVWRRASDLAGDADALKRDAEFVTGTVLPALSDARPDRLYINGAFAGIEGAENCEPDLLRLLFAPVGAA